MLLLLAALTLAPSTVAAGQEDVLVALRARVKHVFIIYQENHSFDNYFGTFPGSDNLASTQAQAHGFRQYDPIGKNWVTPFRITDPDTESPSQSRAMVYSKMNGGKMDAFVSAQEGVSQRRFGPAGARDVGLLTMAHYDCDTIPYLWKYARSFALYDRIFSAIIAPSTPSAIELIAGQAGETQWARDPQSATAANEAGPGVPVTNDLDPAYGPYSESDKQLQISQRYATLMLALAGVDATQATNETQGVAKDLGAVVTSGRAPIPWGWYQEGYISPTQALPGYETHHNAPQYFGYLRQNDVFWKNEHEVHAMLQALQSATLPDRGIFYIKGGSQNRFGWKPANTDPYVQANYRGDDDHPGAGDSDAQVGEAFVATFVNAIARSPYWNDSAIIITWDDPGGYYDHVPPPQFGQCADQRPCGDGPRLPLILISPFVRDGAVVHDAGDQTSILKFAETLFDVPPLASLPEEKAYLPRGPRDADAALSDLVSGFDPARLAGAATPIPAANAEIEDSVVNAFPPAMSCASLGITPVTLPNAPSAPPANFNARPLRARPSK
ncbi:MAG TPA: alkaline phosphatase family protein [Candidatus Binatia bacterium]|nr:alkaline phosphatase family protein [Candidatus Binatia bacterium]